MILLTIVCCIVILLLLITWAKVNPFFAFLIVAIITGIALGMPLETIPKTIQKGMGDMLGSLTIIIIFGTCLGKLAAETGAAEMIAKKLIYFTGVKNIKLGLMVAGLIIGIPMFYSIGFVLLVPLALTLAKKYNIPAVPLAIPMLSALSVAHGFLPPHPSPVALATQLHASMSLTLMYGLILAIPCIFVAGLYYSRFLTHIVSEPKVFELKQSDSKQEPSFINSLLTTLLPVIFMLASHCLELWVKEPSLLKIVHFVGDPSISIILALMVATYTLGIKQQYSMQKVMEIYTESIKDIAILLLIISGSGALKEVFISTGFGTEIIKLTANLSVHPFLLAWAIAALIRLLIGSATVAGLMTATIILPIVSVRPDIDTNLLVLSIGAGSLIGSHINDGAFWLFKEYFNLSVKDTLKSWTVMESLVSVIGIIGVFILNLFLH